MRRAPTIIVLLAFVLASAGGCVFFKEENLPSDPTGLMSLGREKMAAEKYEQAREQFERVLETTPDNEMRVEALMNLANTFYKNREYEEARYQYRKFLELYPVHPMAPKAQFQLAMSNFAEIRTPDRDQHSTNEAIRQFERFLQAYPDHPLEGEARERMEFCLNRLAEHDLEVSRFYYKQGRYHSAINRLNSLLENHPEFSHNDEALYLLGESYRKEESIEKAQAVFARLVNEHPDSQYASSAKRALSKWQRQGG